MSSTKRMQKGEIPPADKAALLMNGELPHGATRHGRPAYGRLVPSARS